VLLIKVWGDALKPHRCGCGHRVGAGVGAGVGADTVWVDIMLNRATGIQAV
jgi:hypothetical protein